LVSWLILAREALAKEDERGFGNYPPCECLPTAYEVGVKVCSYNRDYEASEL
jgi:hypothetical protein